MVLISTKQMIVAVSLNAHSYFYTFINFTHLILIQNLATPLDYAMRKRRDNVALLIRESGGKCGGWGCIITKALGFNSS